ncbi:hypothetical protein RG959_18440 [Domibacillus sp. 8LH]|uniref:hypothetical protein n=1 Tax=Domibacillus sp. 8LH TaxID=3073900 RepID=UPI00316BFB9C
MKREEAVLRQLEVLTEKKQVLAERKQMLAEETQVLEKMESLLNEFIVIPKAAAKEQKPQRTLPQLSKQISYKDLAVIVEQILLNNPTMKKEDLEQHLLSHHNLKWKKFNDTISSLKKYLSINVTKEGKDIYYSLGE